ncbi:MAG: AIR synthase-related protein [Candidatus Jettenia sp.]|nr:MAG: AIR synthase-related protein [Candidatus Jettenia sp.]
MKITQKLIKYGLKTTLGEELLTPTKIYVEPILKILDKHKAKKIIKGMAHITGGGLLENIPRILPDGCAVKLERAKWSVPKIFSIIQDLGKIKDEEMFHVFNMGIGMVLIVSKSEVEFVLRDLNISRETGTIIGEIVEGDKIVHII